MRAELSEKDEILLRQIHPGFLFDGEPSSQAFQPTPKDGSRLSVDRGSLTNASAAYLRYRDQGYRSDAVYGVTVGEFDVEAIPCLSDPLPANSTHAYADYSAYSGNQQKNKAKRIKLWALKRGRLHP